jgi:hypothetical protein
MCSVELLGVVRGLGSVADLVVRCVDLLGEVDYHSRWVVILIRCHLGVGYDA